MLTVEGEIRRRGISNAFFAVFNGRLGCRRCAGRLSVYVQSCRSAQHYAGSRREEVGVHTGLMLPAERNMTRSGQSRGFGFFSMVDSRADG